MKSRVLFFLVMFCFFSGCAGTKKTNQSEFAVPPLSDSGESSQSTIHGPLPEPAPENRYGPAPALQQELVIVLGPGMARNYASAGVLRVFKEAKLPIAAFVASESGALIAEMASETQSVNAFDWRLLQFHNRHFKEKTLSSFLGEASPFRKLENEAKEQMAKTRFSSLSVPLFIGVFHEQRGEVELQSEGDLSLWLRATLSENGFLPPVQVKNERFRSIGSIRPFPIDLARALKMGPVIAIDVIQSFEDRSSDQAQAYSALINGSYRRGQDELEEADLVIRPRLDGIGYFDFSEKSTSLFRGKKAGQEALRKVRALIGQTELNEG